MCSALHWRSLSPLLAGISANSFHFPLILASQILSLGLFCLLTLPCPFFWLLGNCHGLPLAVLIGSPWAGPLYRLDSGYLIAGATIQHVFPAALAHPLSSFFSCASTFLGRSLVPVPASACLFHPAVFHLPMPTCLAGFIRSKQSHAIGKQG